MFIYPCYSVVHQSEGLKLKVNTYRRTGSQRLAVGIELPNAIIGLILQSQKSVASSHDHEHVGDRVINDKTAHTKLRREEDLIWGLSFEKWANIENYMKT